MLPIDAAAISQVLVAFGLLFGTATLLPQAIRLFREKASTGRAFFYLAMAVLLLVLGVAALQMALREFFS